MNANVMTTQQEILDLNIILDALINNDFVDSTETYVDANTVEYNKVDRDGSETVFTVDFNSYTVNKDRYNNKGVRQNDASFNRTVKHTRDIEVIANAIV